jgi:hypothetical protein
VQKHHQVKKLKKQSHDKVKKHLQDRAKKHPDIIKPVGVVGVVDEVELKVLLRFHKQSDWQTRVRVNGLLLLIDAVTRNLKKGVASISPDLGRSYVSKLREGSHRGVVKEPLPRLCCIGIMEIVHPAMLAHIKTSARIGWVLMVVVICPRSF